MDSAIDEVSKPDSYFLTPCKKPEESTSDELTRIIELYKSVMIDYADCYHRHNNLILQVK